uniref:Uncharacterized protein n=1 Tax=Arundo donax TaxID=35708 RepID=A0A0A8ZIG9_ARUDO
MKCLAMLYGMRTTWIVRRSSSRL